jgi:hypothetical protein
VLGKFFCIEQLVSHSSTLLAVKRQPRQTSTIQFILGSSPKMVLRFQFYSSTREWKVEAWNHCQMHSPGSIPPSPPAAATGVKFKKGLLLPVTRIFIVVLSTYIIARTLSTYNIVDICFLLVCACVLLISLNQAT